MNSLVKYCLGTVLLSVAVSACAKEPRRIDGTSDSSFEKSYARVVQPLSAANRREFALALLAVLLPHRCLGTDAVMSLTFLPVSPKDTAGIRPCRELLNGRSFQDITEEANSRRGSPNSEEVQQSVQPDRRDDAAPG
jgi:hypothetical protein